MNTNFYNSKLTFITQGKFQHPLPSFFVPFHGDIEKVHHQIKLYEYTNDEVFSGHLIVNDYNKFVEINNIYALEKVARNPIDFKQAIFYHVQQEPAFFDCVVDDSVALLSSFALTFYAFASRTKNNIYGNLIRHRIIPSKFNKIPKLDIL